MKIIPWFNSLRPAIPMSMEKPCTEISNSEIKRLIQQGGVLINGERCTDQEEIDFPVFSVVFFPKAKRRTTII